jgi:hypothetical protein
MGMLEDVMKALERIPIWKRVSALPAEVEALKKRVADLEAKVAGGGADRCPICDTPGFRRTKSAPDPVFKDMGVLQDTFECSACNHTETRQRETFQR